jgi:hypothetical protein
MISTPGVAADTSRALDTESATWLAGCSGDVETFRYRPGLRSPLGHMAFASWVQQTIEEARRVSRAHGVGLIAMGDPRAWDTSNSRRPARSNQTPDGSTSSSAFSPARTGTTASPAHCARNDPSHQRAKSRYARTRLLRRCLVITYRPEHPLALGGGPVSDHDLVPSPLPGEAHDQGSRDPRRGPEPQERRSLI